MIWSTTVQTSQAVDDTLRAWRLYTTQPGSHEGRPISSPYGEKTEGWGPRSLQGTPTSSPLLLKA